MPFGRHAPTEKQLFGIILLVLIINQLPLKELIEFFYRIKRKDV